MRVITPSLIEQSVVAHYVSWNCWVDGGGRYACRLYVDAMWRDPAMANSKLGGQRLKDVEPDPASRGGMEAHAKKMTNLCPASRAARASNHQRGLETSESREAGAANSQRLRPAVTSQAPQWLPY